MTSFNLLLSKALTIHRNGVEHSDPASAVATHGQSCFVSMAPHTPTLFLYDLKQIKYTKSFHISLSTSKSYGLGNLTTNHDHTKILTRIPYYQIPGLINLIINLINLTCLLQFDFPHTEIRLQSLFLSLGSISISNSFLLQLLIEETKLCGL